MNDFRLLMIGAMYENGGNTTHRFLDGHPQMFVYPFESQLGTKYVNDLLSGVFPVKYRWPAFPLEGSARSDYAAIIDEECKVRTRTPQVSKFRHVAFDLSDDARRDLYEGYINQTGRSTASNVTAFFRSTFDAWKDFRRTGKEVVHVGYSPIITVDADRVLRDLPSAHVLHIVRNPWSAFADTSKRPVPMSLANYLLGWTLNQYYALVFREQFPERMHILRIEDVIANPRQTLGKLCGQIGVEPSDSLDKVSWNGQALTEVYPWGTIRKPTPEANRETAQELTRAQIDEIRIRAHPYLEAFDYKNFI